MQLAHRVLGRGLVAMGLVAPGPLAWAVPERGAGPASPLDAGSILQVVLGLVVVLLAIGASVWVLRHVLRLQPGMNGQLRVLAGLSMGPREKIVLLKVGDTQLLVGVAPGRVHTLHVLERPLEEPNPGNRAGSGFAAQLSHALRKTGRRHNA